MPVLPEYQVSQKHLPALSTSNKSTMSQTNNLTEEEVKFEIAFVREVCVRCHYVPPGAAFAIAKHLSLPLWYLLRGTVIICTYAQMYIDVDKHDVAVFDKHFAEDATLNFGDREQVKTALMMKKKYASFYDSLVDMEHVWVDHHTSAVGTKKLTEHSVQVYWWKW